MPNPLRTLRRIAATKWQVIIDTHSELTAEDIASANEHGYDFPVVKGQRRLGEPVAVISQDAAGTYHAFVQKDPMVADFTEVGTDASLQTLARRIADGEFDYDFRFEYYANLEPSCPADLYYMTRYAVPSQIQLDSYGMDDPGRDIEAAREAQAFTLEERLGPYGLEWQRERGMR